MFLALALALALGAGAGGGAVAFRYLILAFTKAFTGHPDYSAGGHRAYGYFHGVGFWFGVTAPVVGGLLYGPLILLFAREARGHGVPEVMLAVAERGGLIRPQVAVVKSLASALCIGSGGSVGREGPIVQIGSALGSTLGQLTRLPESRLRILVACGAAGGISATFNAPIGGVFFGLELILRDFEAESFGVVVLSSFVADIIGRAAFGPNPFLTLPGFQLRSPVEYPLYIGLGVVAALVGVSFIRVLYGAEDLADRLWRGRPEWPRPAVGGLLLGLVLLALTELYGVGYPPLERAIRGGYLVWFLLLLLAGKILATSLTIAIGGSGGVFAPSLFIGAMLGSAYGTGVHHLLPHLTAPAGTYGIVGMGAVFAAAARAPITAVIIIFELTGDYRIILPLTFAIALAAGISSLLSSDTIYTLKLRRRGIDIMQLLRVTDAMQPLPSALPADTPLNEAIARLADRAADGLPESTATEAIAAPSPHNKSRRRSARTPSTPPPASSPSRSRPSHPAKRSRRPAVHSYAPAPGSSSPRRAPAHPSGGSHTSTSCAPTTPRLERAIPTSPSETPPSADWREQLHSYRVVDLEFATDEPPVGSRLGELDWPDHTSVLAIRRRGISHEPTDDTLLEHGDRLTVLVPATDVEKLPDAITNRQNFIGNSDRRNRTTMRLLP